MDRVLLPVKRFKQVPSECAVAAVSSIANFFDRKVNYDSVREMLPKEERSEGLHTSQQGRLLNRLGFDSVTIVTADLSIIDFTWDRLSKSGLIKRLKKKRAYCKRHEEENWYYVNDLIKWLEDKRYDNNLVIDYDFKKHIKRQLNRGVPVGAAINWTSFFKFSKERKRQKDDIRGEHTDHAIVLRGYDDKGVFIVDSHHQYYKGKLAKFKSGRYKVSWSNFLVNIPAGDLILV